MQTLRRDSERRHVQRGADEAWQTFCPAGAGGPGPAAFGVLARLTELRLGPGASAVPRPADEAELVIYAHRGALAQEDSTGRSGVIHAGEFRCQISGGRGRHKVTNASPTDWAHLFIVALHPAPAGLQRAVEQKRFTTAQRRNLLCVVASTDGRQGSLRLHQNALICSSVLDAGQHLIHQLLPGRRAWLHLVDGEAKLDDLILSRGDGVGVAGEPSVSLTVQHDAEILLVEVGAAIRG